MLGKLSAATGARILFSSAVLGPTSYAGNFWNGVFNRASAGERDLTMCTHVRPSGFVFGLQSNLPPVRGASWDRLKKMSFEERQIAIHDEATCAALTRDARKHRVMGLAMRRIYFMGNQPQPQYTQPRRENLLTQARRAGEHWSETFLRLSRENEGRALFTLRLFSANLPGLSELIKNKNVLPGLGDAGAHVSQIMDAGWPSFMLSHWVRAEQHFTMGEAIRRMTSASARVMGLQDRGLLAPGMRADINVLDPETVSEQQRFIQRANGYRATLVNGEISLIDGEHTGARAGQVLRPGARS